MFDDIIQRKREIEWIPIKATRRKLKAKWTLETNEELRQIYKGFFNR